MKSITEIKNEATASEMSEAIYELFEVTEKLRELDAKTRYVPSPWIRALMEFSNKLWKELGSPPVEVKWGYHTGTSDFIREAEIHFSETTDKLKRLLLENDDKGRLLITDDYTELAALSDNGFLLVRLSANGIEVACVDMGAIGRNHECEPTAVTLVAEDLPFEAVLI